MPNFKIKRVYEKLSENDGFLVLCDRFWPRGVKKEALPIDMWAKEITPSTEMRTSPRISLILRSFTWSSFRKIPP